MIAEQQLIRWLQQKDKRAIEALYDQYSAALYGMLLRMTQDEMLAQDILQEAFVKVWKNGNRYDAQKGRLFTWLINIARNTAINTLQSKAHRNSQKNQSLQNLVHPSENSTLIQQTNVNKIGLTGLVNQLEDKYRIIIELIYFQGYTQKEIEEHLDIPLGTVKSRLRIGLRELRKVFEYERRLISIVLLVLATIIQ
ncbi:MAG: sigma-70 family RNA polymerase sigma factor [Bacteroidota bacterium]